MPTDGLRATPDERDDMRRRSYEMLRRDHADLPAYDDLGGEDAVGGVFSGMRLASHPGTTDQDLAILLGRAEREAIKGSSLKARAIAKGRALAYKAAIARRAAERAAKAERRAAVETR